MPLKPSWRSRIPDALVILNATDQPYIHARNLEVLLAISLRAAQDLIKTAPFVQKDGRSYLLRREDAITWLEAVRDGESLDWETNRRKSFAERFVQIEKEWVEGDKCRRIEIPAPVSR